MNTYLYILLLLFLPLIYKLGFWLYVVQLKEYRLDRIFDYLKTPQGKKAIFNILFFIELIVLFCGILFFLGKISQIIMYNIFVFFLQFESLFVFYKLLKTGLFFPKKTGRILILALLVILGLCSVFFNLYFNQIWLYVVIPGLFAFFFLYVFFWNFITSPFFDYKKEQIFNKAGEKTKNIKTKIIGIAGSFGKSSVKEFLSTLLNGKYKVLKTPKNINTEIGISNLILKTDFSKYDYFVSEMGAYRKGEIKKSGEILNYKDAFVVGIGNQHIGLFGSQQNILDAKFEAGYKIFENNGKLYVNFKLRPIDGKIILNGEKYGIPEIYQKLLNNKQVIFYGIGENADYSVNIQKVGINGTYFRFYKKGVDLFGKNLFVKILGKGQIENLSGAIAYLCENKFSKNEIEESLKNIEQVNKTLKITIKNLGVKIDNEEKAIYIDDSYNLSVNGLLNGINLMNEFDGKKVLVMDDILELGNNAGKIHYELGKQIAKKVDELFFVGVNYKQDIINGMKDGGFHGKILDKFPSYFVEATVVLFEGKKAGRYIK